MNFRGQILVLLTAFSLTSFAQGLKGKIGDGGGNVLSPDFANPNDLRDFINYSKKDLRLFIKAELTDYENNLLRHNNSRVTAKMNIDLNLYKKLYGGPKTLWDVIQSTEIEIAEDKPCYEKIIEKDENGVEKEKIIEKDASIYASKPGAICISLFRLMARIPEERAQAEVLSLLLHEFTHLLGTSEGEADAYHRIAFKHLIKFDLDTSSSYLLHGAQASGFQQSLLEKKAKWFASNPSLSKISEEDKKWFLKDLQEIRKSAYDLGKKFNNVSLERIQLKTSLHNSQEGDRNFWQHARLWNVMDYISQELAFDKKDYLPDYDHMFAGNKSISLDTFIKRKGYTNEYQYHKFSPARPNTYANQPIVRITSHKELAQELRELADYWKEESDLAYDMFNRK